MLLCLRCNGDIPGLNENQISGALRISIDELQKTQKELLSVGLISDNYDIPKWSERQFHSDSSTVRVHKYRDRKSETLLKRRCNGDVTARYVSVSVSKSVSEFFNIFWNSYPKKVGKGAALKSFNKIKPNKELLDKMIETILWQRTTKDWNKDDGQYIPNPATWLNQERWQDEKPAQKFVVGMNAPGPELSESEFHEREINRLKIKINEWSKHEKDGNLDERSLIQLNRWRKELASLTAGGER